MSKDADDFQAVKLLVETLSPFDDKDRERIIRWAKEKLGMANPNPSGFQAPQQSTALSPLSLDAAGLSRSTDIRQFAAQKQPRSDIQFAAMVAYYYRFEAPEVDRKEEIDQAVLLDACRKADRVRPPSPSSTLNNAHRLGLLDRGSGAGKFRINSVGENLVAMALPESKETESAIKPRKSIRKKKKAKKAK